MALTIQKTTEHTFPGRFRLLAKSGATGTPEPEDDPPA